MNIVSLSPSTPLFLPKCLLREGAPKTVSTHLHVILYKSGVSSSWGGATAARGPLLSSLPLLTMSVSVTFFFLNLFFWLCQVLAVALGILRGGTWTL